MKRAVSVSLGSSGRDKASTVTMLGQPIRLERIGTDGSLEKFSETFRDLDGKVDCFGVGGADLHVVVGERRYAFRQIVELTKGAVKTPIVDGGGLKHTLERETIRRLQRDGTYDPRGKRVLLVSAVDRFGMAQALEEAGASVVYGDIPFGTGVNLPLTRYAQVERFGRAILPIVTRLPFKWFYPTGPKQEERTPKFGKLFENADLICGDWHYIRRYMPARMDGKTVLTQTLRTADYALLRESGAARSITTTPEIEGETFATNVMEAALVALLGRRPEELAEGDYLEALGRLGWKPNAVDL